MTTDQALSLSLQDIIRSNIEDKYMADYGVVSAVYGTPVTTIDVTHFIPGYYDANGNPQPNITYGVEVLYTAMAGLSVEVPLSVGDSVLLVGSRRLVNSIVNVTTANSGTKPTGYMPLSYTKDTLKAIPIGDLATSSAIYLRFKAGKMQLKNTATSLYTALNNFESAVATFSNAASQAAISTGGSSSAALASAINVLLVALNISVVSAQTALGQIMEA
jgi:hypothetical protein